MKKKVIKKKPKSRVGVPTIAMTHPEVLDRFLADFGGYTYGAKLLAKKIPKVKEKKLQKISDQLMYICDDLVDDLNEGDD